MQHAPVTQFNHKRQRCGKARHSSWWSDLHYWNYQRSINGACWSSISASAAGVPAACFGVALMPVVQALSCVLETSSVRVISESSVEHPGRIKWSLHQNVMLAASTSPSAFIIPPVLLADLGRLMNDDAWLSSAGTRSSPANARCAGCLPPFLIIYAKHAGSTQFLSKKCGGWWAAASIEPRLLEKECNFEKEEDVHVTNWMFVELKLHDLSQPFWPTQGPEQDCAEVTGDSWKLQFTGPICHHHPHDTIGISPSENLKVSLIWYWYALSTVKMESLCRLHAAISTSARSLRLWHPANLSTSHWQPGAAKKIGTPNRSI